MNFSAHRALDKAVPLFALGLTVLVFLPILHWLLRRTMAHEQLMHAFLVFILTGFLVVMERRLTIRPAWSFSGTVQHLLIASYMVLAAALLTRINLVILLALGLAMAAILVFLFGEERRRLVFSSVSAFTLFAGFAVLLPLLDWPLRSLAGQWSADGLGLIGQEAQLGLYTGREEPMLLLFNNGQPFHVAAECNGFGMLTSCLLMALLIVLYRRIPLIDKAAWLAFAALFGAAFNTLRIIVIVLLAPRIPEGQYMLMHEAVGLATTYGGLGLLYVMLMPRPPREPAAPAREAGA